MDRTDGLTEAEAAAAMAEYDAVMPTLGDRFGAGAFRGNLRCKLLANFGAGFNHIDVSAAAAAGIAVTNTPDAVTEATADIALTLILMTARRAGEGERMLRSKTWPGWAPLQLVGRRLDGKVLGIYGFGKIGQQIAKFASAFDMKIHYHDIYRLPEDKEKALGATYHPTLDSLLAVSEFLSINTPSTPETRFFFNKSNIEKLPQGAIVINTARGDLVNDDDLIAALKSGRLAAAGLDVFNGEPKINEGYYGLENTFLLPHLGSAAIEARNQMGFEALDNLDAAFAGKPMPFKLV